jgi:NTP pyrophosphatase (non-canonical NTP hydrolase)
MGNITGLEQATLDAVLAESMKAEAKHGFEKTLRNPDLSVALKLAALMEEVGEVAEMLTYDKGPETYIAPQYRADPSPDEIEAALANWRDDFVKELIQVANVALAWAESVGKGGN